ncbi:7787_t:CDS:1, partial [Racocetra fulgida]
SEKQCGRCDKYKTHDNFIRLSEGKMKKFAICNTCAESRKEKRCESVSELASAESLNIPGNEDVEMIIQNDENAEMIIHNDEDGAWFSLTDVENLIANSFKNAEDGCVHFSGTLKFDNEFISNMSSENQDDKE